MMKRLRDALFPTYNDQERLFRIRLAHILIRAAAALTVLWGVSEVLLHRGSAALSGLTPTTEMLAIVILAVVLAVAEILLLRGRLRLPGYVLATAFFAFPAFYLMMDPEDLLLVSPALLVSVLVAGATVGPATGYLFAAASLGIDVAAWRLTGEFLLPATLSLHAPSVFAFLVVQGATLILTAILLDAFTSQARRTFQQLNRQTQQMTELAHTDSLTGLANRRWLLELLEREFLRARRYRRPLSLIYLDLDGFKLVNDRFGHLFGDGILRSAARSMQAVLRATDLLARIGGDEFAVLLPETDLPGAEKVAAKIHRALAASTRPYGAELPPLSFAAGICQLRDDDRSIDDILVRADDAQYVAKAVGPGTIRTQTDLDTKPMEPPVAATGKPHDGADARA